MATRSWRGEVARMTVRASRPAAWYSILEYAAACASTRIPSSPALETSLLQPFASPLLSLEFSAHFEVLPVSRPSKLPARLPRCSHLWVQLHFVPSSRAGEQQPTTAPSSGFDPWTLPEGGGSAHLATCVLLQSVHVIRALDRVPSRPNADNPPRRYHDASSRIYRIRLQVLRVALQAGHQRRARRQKDARNKGHYSGQWCTAHPCVRDLILPWASNLVPCIPIGTLGWISSGRAGPSPSCLAPPTGGKQPCSRAIPAWTEADHEVPEPCKPGSALRLVLTDYRS